MNRTQVNELRAMIRERFDQMREPLYRRIEARRQKERDAQLAKLRKLDERFEKRLVALLEAAFKAVENDDTIGVRVPPPHTQRGTMMADDIWLRPEAGVPQGIPSLFYEKKSSRFGDWNPYADPEWKKFNALRNELDEKARMLIFDSSSDVQEFLNQIPTIDELMEP